MSDLNATPTDQNMWVAVLILGLAFLAAAGFTVFNQWPEPSLYAILVAVSGALLVALSLWAPITVSRAICRVLSFGTRVRQNRDVSSAMNATGATLVFSVSFAAMALAGAYAYGESIGIALFGLALNLPPGAFTFWFGARRVRHKWYFALFSGLLAFAVAVQTIHVLSPVLSLWLLLLATDVAIAAVGFLLGRMPLFHAELTRRSRRDGPRPAGVNGGE